MFHLRCLSMLPKDENTEVHEVFTEYASDCSLCVWEPGTEFRDPQTALNNDEVYNIILQVMVRVQGLLSVTVLYEFRFFCWKMPTGAVLKLELLPIPYSSKTSP